MSFPPPMHDAAFHGPIGEAVLALEPKVEGVREAFLVETLVFYGNAIGRTAYFQVGRTRHHANEYVALAGETSRSRKGSTRDVAVDLIRMTDPAWAENGITGGATSGEGIVAAVRDPRSRRRKATKDEKKDLALTHDIDGDDYIVEEVDAGVADKRRVFDEGELSAVFKVAMRDGNTLTERLRTFYDQGWGEVSNKNSPMKATNAHISINGHVTREELRARLDELDAANGWGNRFLFCATRRARRLPAVVITDDELAPHASELALGIAWAREHNPCLRWGDEAFREWCAFYNAASDNVRGIVGALTARSEAHVLRLALMYAVADRSEELRREHLDAARAVWRYCEHSVAWIWEGKLGDPDAERIFEALRAAGRPGMSRTSIRDLFSHDKDAQVVDAALALLADHRLAVARMVSTSGRPAQWWWAAERFAESQATGTERDRRDQSPPKSDPSVPSVPFGPGPGASENGTPAGGVPPSEDAAHERREATCGNPAHRHSDWAFPAGKIWICGICHPPPTAGLRVEFRQAGAGQP